MSIKGFQGEDRWLSNFWGVPIHWLDQDFDCTECAYQASKIDPDKNFLTPADFARMKPGQAKRASRELIIRNDWDEVKEQIMLDLQRLKFKDPWLAQKLKDTYPLHIEETNTWGDTFWGVCNGKGQNKLGKIIMLVREAIY